MFRRKKLIQAITKQVTIQHSKTTKSPITLVQDHMLMWNKPFIKLQGLQ